MLGYSLKTTYNRLMVMLSLAAGIMFSAINWEFRDGNVLQALLRIVYTEAAGDSDSLLLVIINLLPVFIFCIVTSNFFCSDIGTIYTYVFPRSGKITKWYIYKTLSLFCRQLNILQFIF